jgi:hypothetical protein
MAAGKKPYKSLAEQIAELEDPTPKGERSIGLGYLKTYTLRHMQTLTQKIRAMTGKTAMANSLKLLIDLILMAENTTRWLSKPLSAILITLFTL